MLRTRRTTSTVALWRFVKRSSRDLDRGFHFYAPQVRSIWDPDTPWSQFIGWATRFIAWPGFDASERDYELVIGERFARARDAIAAGDPVWLDTFKQGFLSPNNLTSWRDTDRFLKWCAQEPQAAIAGLTTRSSGCTGTLAAPSGR